MSSGFNTRKPCHRSMIASEIHESESVAFNILTSTQHSNDTVFMVSIIGKHHPSPRSLRLPLFETLIPAGFPSPAADYAQNAIDLHERLIHNTQATFFVRTTGDSMRDVGILDGCVLVVDASRTPVSGNIVVASIDGKYVVKRLKKVRGQFELHSENAMVPYPVLRPSSDLQIFGVVTSHIVEHLKKPTRKAK